MDIVGGKICNILNNNIYKISIYKLYNQISINTIKLTDNCYE